MGDYRDRDRDRKYNDRDGRYRDSSREREYRDGGRSTRDNDKYRNTERGAIGNDEDGASRNNRDKEFERDQEHKRLKELQSIHHSSNRNKKRGLDNDNGNPPAATEKWGKDDDNDDDHGDNNKRATKKEKIDYKPSGLLLQDQKIKLKEEQLTEGKSGGVTSKPNALLKWSEPHEARLPNHKWILYPFKDGKSLDPYYLHRQKSYLVGRDRQLVDVATDHPSCSQQHAVIVYRSVKIEDEDGEEIKVIRPYILDLESTNGTFVNRKKIGSAQYYELRAKDMIQFGMSTREYVLLKEGDEDYSSSDDSHSDNEYSDH